MTNRIPWGPDSPGYHKGCPVPAGHDCTVYFRDGDFERSRTPELWGWKHEVRRTDIIAYCDHDAQDQARELLAEARRQLEYLDGRFPTGTTLAVIARINAYLKGAA